MAWSQTVIELQPRPRGFHIITDEVTAAMRESLPQVRVGLLASFSAAHVGVALDQ